MRLIDADKLYPDCLTKDGTLAISQSQIANAPTVEPTFGLFKEMLCSECEKRPTGEVRDNFDIGYAQGYKDGKEEVEQCSYASKQRAYKEGKYDGFMESPYGD